MTTQAGKEYRWAIIRRSEIEKRVWNHLGSRRYSPKEILYQGRIGNIPPVLFKAWQDAEAKVEKTQGAVRQEYAKYHGLGLAKTEGSK